MPETPRRPHTPRHAFLLAACLLLACPPAARGQEEAARPLQSPGRFKRFRDNLLDFLKCKKANVRKRRELLEYGPQFPQRYNVSDFSFEAVVGASWPMVVEYELEEQSTAVVRIEVMGNLPFTQTLAGDGLGVARTARFILPPYKGEGPHPALISLKATRDGAGGEELAGFRLLGMGAGEDAVAALPGHPPLEVAALGPLPPGILGHAPAPPRCACPSKKLCNARLNSTPGGYVYSFCVTTAKFHRWAADIKRRVPQKNTDDYVRVRRDKNVAQRIGPDQTITKVWNGRNDRGMRARPGMYKVFVMVWWSGSSIGPWAFDNPSEPITIR